jgi:hypothetical protein
MQTLVVRIPDDLAADIEAGARRWNSTRSEVVHARLAATEFGNDVSGAGFEFIADPVGGPRDISARKKQHLKATGYGREQRRR